VLEAMASGVPVICSNAASLPEVVGKAGLTFDPNNSTELLTLMRALINDDQQRSTMIEIGLEISRKYSWATTAQQTYDVYQKVSNKT
ncbi:MAG: glycosyltransferase, partial [Anderseniella sp.]